uniref:tyrosine-protein phosphatase non-receptor type 14-like n=1 Tax=Styela clava TaxID=7725 RepID=UPI00193A9FAD|nr:tyrosine-protein phosphatase non-receptor type 14-like [Styela clava]
MLEKALNSVMPFGIKLSRKGRYILSHKNSFLVRVQLLDNTIMECTLTVENTGNDCLHAVANKLDLKEVQYFGLKYCNKQMAVRWVELDKPLKKQVDKNAHDPTLYFGVMYYVANLELLQQEITRYLFYLQLKNNVIDGCLPRSPQEAIELASYMLQAEFGDYNPEVHTVQYFRDFILFPEVMAPNEEILDSLTKETLDLHQRHRPLTPPDAEHNYILKVMHLEGYGEESYVTKDSQNADYEIGCSFVGIVTRHILPASANEDAENSQSPQFTYGKITWYEWNNIDHVLCNKSAIQLNMRKDDTTLQFHMEDVETAKYVCRMFELRRKFYSLNRQTSKKLPVENGEESEIQRRPTLRRTQDTPVPEINNGNPNNDQHSIDTSQRQADFISSQENLQSYARQQEAQYYTSQTSLDHAYVSQTSLNRVPGLQQDYGYANGYIPSGSMYSSPSINSLGHSQTQLNQKSPASSNMSLSSDRHLAGNGVPVYRCTPDYEQAVRQRRRYSSYLENQAVARQHQQAAAAAIQDGSLKPRPHSMIYSQQELIQQAAFHGPHYALYPPHNPPLHYHAGTPQRVDSATHLPASQTQLHRQFESSHESLPPVHGLISQSTNHQAQYNPQEAMQMQDVRLQGGAGAVPGNAILAASTPELANAVQQAKGYSASEMQLLRYYTKPPPPYPRNNSTSTPDLSAHRHSAVSASSPDLHQGYSGIPGQQRWTNLHPVHHAALTEDGYQALAEHNQMLQDGFQPSDQMSVIRGVCTSVEGLHHSQQNMMEMNAAAQQQQRKQTPEQSVQAYLQQLSLEQHSQLPTPPRTKQPGQQHPHARHHRPVSYPPRLNHNHPVLTGVVEQEFLPRNRLPPVPQQNIPLSQSQTSSSASTVGSPYGSQQYLPQQHGSQISLQHIQLAPAAHPILTQHPMPQRAEVSIHPAGSNSNLHYQHPTQLQQHNQVNQLDDQNGEYSDDPDAYEVSTIENEQEFGTIPHHSQMASNVTMVVHSSASEASSSDDEIYSSDDDGQQHKPKTDYRHVPLTTIDGWHREKPTEMYVPPKPKQDMQQFVPNEEDSHEMRLPPPYPEDQNPLSSPIPPIPIIGTEDHDPPKSYRKPDMMESFDEGDMARVSVFPHPHPSPLPHSPKLSNTNPFYTPNMNSNNPFYEQSVENGGNLDVIKHDVDFEDFHRKNSTVTANQKEATSLFADASSGDLRQARRSTRKNMPLKLSTTSSDMNDLATSAGAPDERVLQLEKQVEDGQVLTEYEKIQRKRTTNEALSGDLSGQRDRVKSVLPYSDNRILISKTAGNNDGYINASMLEVEVADQKWSYIACQSPLDDFLHEFWEMIWDQRVNIIAMISKEIEDGRVRCGRYWPEQVGDPSALLFGDYRVSCEIVSEYSQSQTTDRTEDDNYDEDLTRPRSGSTACENLVTSRLVLQKAGTTECRKIWHLQYVGWPDSGAPKEATDFLAFMEELESVRRLAEDTLSEDEPIPPIVVHCASGAGRTGVVILSDLMRHSLEHNKITTVPEMLKTLREQRMHIVQTVSQYNFVYQVLILFLKNSRLI